MTTFTQAQKCAAYQAFVRGWRKAVTYEPIWAGLSSKKKADFLRTKIREEIFNLPEKQSFWQRIKSWLTGKE
jgi:hypothetical protein